MPSPAAQAYSIARGKARRLREIGQGQSLPRDDTRLLLHAALAANVAAWEGYIERLIDSFFTEIVEPQDIKLFSIHSVLLHLASIRANAFNTPNWENCRNILVEYTGYDPINDWAWAGMPGPALHARLNEILKVRHSFAHGYTMPAYAWNTSATGQVRLTTAILRNIDSFFSRLVRQTDKGMSAHIRTIYRPDLQW